MTGFFLPWNTDRKRRKGVKKLHLPKRSVSLEDAAFDTRKPAYVSLPNPRGTLRSFLQAVETGEKEVAMGYFSSRIAEAVDYEELEGYLKDLKEYHCFLEDEGSGIRRVSVAKKNNQDAEIFSFRMVAEPDAYGKWKIFSIEREGKE